MSMMAAATLAVIFVPLGIFLVVGEKVLGRSPSVGSQSLPGLFSIGNWGGRELVG